jgi:hypothetical protein
MVMAFFNAQIFINTADPSKTANSMATELCWIYTTVLLQLTTRTSIYPKDTGHAFKASLITELRLDLEQSTSKKVRSSLVV